MFACEEPVRPIVLEVSLQSLNMSQNVCIMLNYIILAGVPVGGKSSVSDLYEIYDNNFN